MFPNHKYSPLQTASTVVGSVLVPSNPSTKSAADHHNNTTAHQQQHQSKTEAFKKGCKQSYEYFKGQASKVAQMFSIKN